MAFKPPTFNLTCNIWRSTSLVTAPPDLSPICQLRASGKQSSGLTQAPLGYFLPEILFPAHTDVRDQYCPSNADQIECPAGSGRYYVVANVEDVAKGFANEYRQAVVVKARVWPQPIP